MSDAAIKESRRVLRLVQDHLSQAHLDFGAEQQSVGLVDVIHHPENKLPHLNYVSPRKKTAWVPTPEVKKGLERLKEKGRTPRVLYIEGLFPPVFAKSLRELGLMVERELPLITLKITEETPKIDYEPLEAGLSVAKATTQEGMGIWWYVWRNAYFDVVTGGIDPVYIGRDLREVAFGQQVDMILYRYGFSIGVVRVTLYDKTAHINTIAIMQEHRTPDMMRLLYRMALKVIQERECELAFTIGGSVIERTVCRELGFVDSGSIVCYSETNGKPAEDDNASDVEEPVFILR